MKRVLCGLSCALSSKWAIVYACIIGIAIHFSTPTIISQAWAISIFVKSIIISLLPFAMFAILSSGLLRIKENGNKIIGALFLLTFILNLISFLFLYPVNEFTDIFRAKTESATSMSMTIFDPAWILETPIILRSDVAIVLAIIFWVVGKRALKNPDIVAEKMSSYAFTSFQNFFGPAVYIFIMGFVGNLNFSDFIFPIILSNYKILFIILLSQAAFLYLMAAISNGPRVAFTNIYNTFPAAIIGFTTMSSGMAFPKTCDGLRANNVPDKITSVLPSILMPMTIADSFTITALIFFISSIFGFESLSFMNFFIAAIYYSLFKFSNCCMPGGTIMCIMPVLVSQFGFTNEMCVFIASMSLVLDSFTTAGNAIGHGMFGILFNKIFGKLLK
jgi:hypothetical protein